MEKIHEMLHQAEHHLGKAHPRQKRKGLTRPDYGQDVPVFTLLIFLIGIVFSALSVVLFKGLLPNQPIFGIGLSVLFGIIGLIGLASGSFLVWASQVGKFQMRDRIIADIHWRGDEQVLDVGCGAGLLMIGAARRLSTGKAIGVDIWDRNLEYGSSPESVWTNGRIEGVMERIEVKDGNACELPFSDNSFDLVLTSDMLHHLSKSNRAQAVREMARVLKPGGHLIIAEIAFTKQYIQVLRGSGFRAIREVPLKLILWRRIVATK